MSHNCKPRRDQVDNVVDRLDKEPELASEAVSRAQHLGNMDYGVRSSKEGSVKPSSTLTDELGESVRNVCLANGTADISKDPKTLSVIACAMHI